MISSAKKYAEEAKVIVSGMAVIPSKNERILIINLHNTRYRALLDRNGNVISSNMSDKNLRVAQEILMNNLEFL